MLTGAIIILLTSTACLAGPVTTAADSSLASSATPATSTLFTQVLTSGQTTPTDTTATSTTVTDTDTDRSSSPSPQAGGSPKIILKLEEGTTASNFLELYKPSDGNSNLTAEMAPDKAYLISYQPVQGMEATQQGPADLVLPPLQEGKYRAMADGPHGVKKGDEVEGDLALLYLSVKLPSGSDLKCVIERYDTKAVLSTNRQTQDETFAIEVKAWEGVVSIQAANQAYRIVGETDNEEVKMKCQMIATQVKKVSY